MVSVIQLGRSSLIEADTDPVSACTVVNNQSDTHSPALEKRVEGRAKSLGWWMAPKRLGPGGRPRNSGFRPKSSL